jgi:hypothetical protein
MNFRSLPLTARADVLAVILVGVALAAWSVALRRPLDHLQSVSESRRFPPMPRPARICWGWPTRAGVGTRRRRRKRGNSAIARPALVKNVSYSH